MSEPSPVPVLDLLAGMTKDSLEASTLEPQTLYLVRMAALVAVGAPAASYLVNLEAATALGIDAELARGVLTAVAPIVGTARVLTALGRIGKALDISVDAALLALALEGEDDEDDEEE